MPVQSMSQWFPRRTTLRERDQHRMTIRIPTEFHEALLILGRARGWSLNTIVCRALHEYLCKNATWEPVEAWLQRTADRYRTAIEYLGGEDAPLDP